MSIVSPPDSEPRPRSARSAALAWLAMLAVVAWIVGYALYRPGTDTDVIFYAATVHQWEGLDPAAIHTAAYEDVQKLLPPATYDRMIAENDYMQTVTADPQALVEQIPFYSVKVLYPAMLLVLSHIGIPLGFASVLISALSYGLLAVLLFVWLRRYLSPWSAWLATSLLVLSPPFAVLAATESPDALGLLLATFGLFVILELRRPNLGMAILIATVLARPNAVIAAVAVAGALALLSPSNPVHLSLRRAIAWATGAVAVAAALSVWSHNYGLGTLFYFAVVAYLPYPAAGAPALPLHELLRLYVYKIATLTSTPIPLFVLLGVLGIRARITSVLAIRTDAYCMVVVAMFGAIALGWLTYPNEPERILAPGFLACAVVMAVSIRSWWTSTTLPDPRPALPA